MTGPDRKFKELGEFLRIRRESLSPETVGLPPRRRTRTTGLRREDVATRAAVSLSWYTWLEQGRDVRPSAQVLLNVARALALSTDDETYMFDLAGQVRPAPTSALRTSVSPAVQHLLDALDVPAYVLNQRWDRIAWNAPLLALMGDFSNAPAIERNIIWRAFLDEGTRAMTSDWRETARRAMAEFQASSSRHIHEPWMTDFVAELTRASPEFRAWWPRHDVLARREKINLIFRPPVGEMRFEHLSFQPTDDPDLMFSVFTPADGGETSVRLGQLVEAFRTREGG